MLNILPFEGDRSEIVAFLTIFKELIIELCPLNIEEVRLDKLPMEGGSHATVFLEVRLPFNECSAHRLKHRIIKPIHCKP